MVTLMAKQRAQITHCSFIAHFEVPLQVKYQLEHIFIFFLLDSNQSIPVALWIWVGFIFIAQKAYIFVFDR